LKIEKYDKIRCYGHSQRKKNETRQFTVSLKCFRKEPRKEEVLRDESRGVQNFGGQGHSKHYAD
jgi:hypothetical protein